MAGYATLHAALVDKLRGSGIVGISWGENDNPYYEEAIEGTKFPYVVLTIPESEIQHTMETSYEEVYRPEITVVCLEPDVERLASPYKTSSVFFFLDDFRDNYAALNGENFSCGGIERASWVLHKSSLRGPDGARVWEATGVYNALITCNV